MADNITAPAAGTVLATDDVGGVHYPRTKIAVGADGSAADVSVANPLPVALNGPQAVTGTFWPTTQPVSATDLPLPSGAATSAKQDAITAAVNGLGSASSWFPITPANSNLTTVPDAIYVGGAGTIVARGSDSVEATFTVEAGQILPISPLQVRTGSTATGLVGLVA